MNNQWPEASIKVHACKAFVNVQLQISRPVTQVQTVPEKFGAGLHSPKLSIFVN